jgi:hypothetical protein
MEIPPCGRRNAAESTWVPDNRRDAGPKTGRTKLSVLADSCTRELPTVDLGAAGEGMPHAGIMVRSTWFPPPIGFGSPAPDMSDALWATSASSVHA